MANHRKKRLEELIKRIIGDLLLKDVKDPRIGFVSVYRVELNDDFTLAKVLVSIIGTHREKICALHGLNAASGFLKFHMGKELSLRVIPDLCFELDDSIEKSMDVINLIDSLNIDKTDKTEKTENEEEGDKGE